MLEKAIQIAKEKHEGQFRKNGEPVINHPLAVMNILKEKGFPEELLTAAVLHDILEDTDKKSEELFSEFGERVAFVVYSLSKKLKPVKTYSQFKRDFEADRKKISEMYDHKCKSLEDYIDYRFQLYMSRFYMSVSSDPWILYIKIADQIHNLSTMESFTPEKRQRKIKEVEKYFMPVYEKAEKKMIPEADLPGYKELLKDLKGVLNKLK